MSRHVFVVGLLVGLMVGCIVWDVMSDNLLMSRSVMGLADMQQACESPAASPGVSSLRGEELRRSVTAAEVQLGSAYADLYALQQEATVVSHEVSAVKGSTEDALQRALACEAEAGHVCGREDGVDVRRVLAEVTRVRNDIQRTWDGIALDPQALLSQERFSVANRDLILKRLQMALVRKKEWLMAYFGTSVTAGHDNMYNESYPFVVERRLRPIFEAAGVAFEVRNFAMGNYGCFPGHVCANDIIDERADYVSWEFEMMQCAGFAASVFARAMWSRERQPILDFSWRTLSAYGKNYPNELPLRTWRDAVPPHYGERFPLISSYIGKQVYQWTKDKANAKLWDFEVVMGPLPGPDGRKKVLGFAPWHPSPYGHQLLGDVDANYWAQLIGDAVASLGDPSSLQAPPRIPLPPDERPWASLPYPLWRASCRTDWLPQAHGNSLSVWGALEGAARWGALEGWRRALWGPSLGRVTEAERLKTGYLDRKVNWMNLPSKGDAVPLVFEWEQRVTGPVILCAFGPLQTNNATLRVNSFTVVLDSKKVDLSQTPWYYPTPDWKKKWPQVPFAGHCACPEVAVGEGRHTMSVTLHAVTPHDDTPHMEVTHFIHW